ncbi:MAG: T9SS type A sorting domain-containing protein, partial [Ferruginibacter sp.]
QEKQQYAHANTLTQHEKDEIMQWVNNFAPLGDANQIPVPPVYSNDYQMTSPDQVLQIPSYTVNTTNDHYRVFVLPINNSSQQFIREIEVVPGNREIVHHVLVFQDSSSIPLQLDNNDPLPGYTAFGGTGSPTSRLITGYTPGQGIFRYPPGFGVLVLPRSYIILQIHYPGGISNQTDSTQIRIRYGPGTLRNMTTVAALNHNTSLTNGPLFIPANTVKTFYSQLTVPTNRTVTGIMPHMHLLGKKIKSYCIKPNGDTIHLVDIPEWDFHWQGFYQFQKPILIPAGSVLYGEATYDNTSANSHNPNFPPQDVQQGEGTDDEMMLIYFNVAPYQPGDTTIIIDTASHLTHHNGCTNEGNPNPASTVTIYPNPADGYFIIDGLSSSFDIILYSASGQEVLIQKNLNGRSTVHTNSLPTGTYYLEIRSMNNPLYYKVVMVK